MRYIQTLVNPDGTPSVEHGPLECETTRRAFLHGIVYLMQTNHATRTKAKDNFPRVYKHELYNFNGTEYVLEDNDVRELHAMFTDPKNLLLAIPAGLNRLEKRLERASFRAMLRVLAQEAGAPPPDFRALGAMLAKRSNGDE
jgi:hypothetical protein